MIRDRSQRAHRGLRRLRLVLVVLSALGIGGLRAAGAETSTPIRVACLDVTTNAVFSQGAKKMLRCLPAESNFTFRTITGAEIRSNGLAQVDVLICPGGSGSKQSRVLDDEGRRAVREFVQNGGGYVGFCAGAYLASSHYTWSLGLINARVVDTAHWARGTGSVSLRMTPEGRELLGTTNEVVTCYYGQGPLLAPGTNSALPDYRVLATYDSEIAKKGAPTGVMTGTTAIASGLCGKGRVLCFSPHPESGRSLNHFVGLAVRWAAGRD